MVNKSTDMQVYNESKQQSKNIFKSYCGFFIYFFD